MDFKYKFDTYSKDSYQFPKDDIDPAKKGKEWCKAYSEAILSNYYRGLCATTFDTRNKYFLLRSYSNGRQSSAKYKNFYLGNEVQGEEREGWMNVNFDDIFSPAPSIVAKIQGIFQSTEHDIQVEDTGIKAGAERESKKEALWFEKLYEPQLSAINQALGVATENKVLPDTRDELELFATLGGFKLAYETYMEACIDVSLYESNNKILKDKVIKDLIDLNIACTIDTVDTDTQRVYQQYIDIADLIMDYTKQDDFTKSNFAALPEFWTINDLRKKTQPMGIDEDELKATAMQYVGYVGNPQFWNDNYGVMNSHGVYPYSSWKIPVLYSTWKSVNSKYRTKKLRSDGVNENVYDSKFGKFWDTENKKTTITDINVIYQCRWVIGTDIVFDDGLMNDIVREGKTAKLPFHVCKIHGKSIMESMMPVLDEIMLVKLRYQNAIAMCPPPGIAINWDATEAITLGNKSKNTPYDFIKFYRQTGAAVYRGKSLIDGSTAGPPITPIDNGMGTIMEETIKGLDAAFMQLSQVSGIDPVTLSVDQKGEQPSATSEKLATASTNNCLKPIYSAYIHIKEDYAKSAAYRIQLICKYNEDDTRGYNGVIGDVGVKAIAEAGDRNVIQFGIKIQARPTEQDKADILKAAEESLGASKEGQPGITMSDYLYISQLIRTASGLKYATAYLNYKEGLAAKNAQQVAQQNSQMNGQVQMQAEQQKNELAKDLEKFKTDQAIRLEEAKAIFAKEADIRKFQQDVEMAGVTSAIDISHEHATNQMQQDQPQQQPPA